MVRQCCVRSDASHLSQTWEVPTSCGFWGCCSHCERDAWGLSVLMGDGDECKYQSPNLSFQECPPDWNKGSTSKNAPHFLLMPSLQAETIAVCTVSQCFPHGNTACNHSCCECRKSREPSVCHKNSRPFCDLLKAVSSQTMECLVTQAKKRHFQDDARANF